MHLIVDGGIPRENFINKAEPQHRFCFLYPNELVICVSKKYNELQETPYKNEIPMPEKTLIVDDGAYRKIAGKAARACQETEICQNRLGGWVCH